MGVVHGAMRGFLPRVRGLRVVGGDADDVERREVAELGSVERFEFAAENEMQQLPAAFLGILCGHAAPSPAFLKLSEIDAAGALDQERMQRLAARDQAREARRRTVVLVRAAA